MKSLAARFPILFVLLVGAIFALCHLLWRLILPAMPPEERSLLEKGTSCLFAILLLAALGWRREAGLCSGRHAKDWLLFLPMAVIPALMLAFGDFPPTSATRLTGFAAVALMTGFAEEVVFRGVAVRALLPRGTMRAAVLSSAVFGALHGANLLAGADPLATGMQMVFATLFGFAAAAPRLVTGTLWPLVVIHGLQDFLAFWSTGGFAERATPQAAEVAVPILLILPIAGFGFLLLRRKTARCAASSVLVRGTR